MDILEQLANLPAVTSSTAVGRTEMTPQQIENCKAAIKRDNRGYNVQPNKFDIANPYRVAINYSNKWHNFGDFESADVAAAIGTIVSAAFFGEKAKLGQFDAAKVKKDPNYTVWLADPRNVDLIARAGDPNRSYLGTGQVPEKVVAAFEDDIPF